MKTILSGLILGACWFQLSSAQEYLNRDSLLNQLGHQEQDTNRVLLYISIGQQYENNQPDSAVYYYLQARDLSELLGYDTGILKYISNITYVYNAQGKYEETLSLNLQAVELAREHGTPIQLAACLGNVSNSYLFLEQYENAIDYLLQANEVIAETENRQYQCVLFNNLAVIYIKLQQPGKSREYALQAVAIAREMDDQYNLGISLDNLAITYIESHAPEDALTYLKQALQIAEQTENLYLKESIMLNFAQACQMKGEFEKMIYYAQEGLSLARELDDIAGEASAYLKLGYYYLFKNVVSEALKYAHLSEEAAASANLKEQLAKAYLLLGQISIAGRNYSDFQKYQIKHDSMENLVVNERILSNIQALNTKYDTEKKVRQINQLENERAIQELRIRQNSLLTLILAGVTFAILTIGLLLFRSNRQKRLILNQENELHASRIAELETEKQLATTEGMLKGQDDERKRLSRDLHDGLGGMLSGIKLSFMNLKDLEAKCLEEQQQFDRSLDMLDGAINELRRIAHNLMPEVLLEFGLDSAVNDLCDSITENGALNVSYQSTGLDKFHPDQTTLVIVYRIVQELLNNVLRHASADQALVQLDFHSNNLGITVEDNGVGFYPSILQTSAGIGWSNIRYRVEYLNGKIDLQSAPYRGATVNIDLPLLHAQI